jgi:hypothetical protein
MDIDSFVNGNDVNVEFKLDEYDIDNGNEFNKLMFETLPARFARMVEHDSVNDRADPVLVYVRDGVFVAWYDMENAYGYIA